MKQVHVSQKTVTYGRAEQQNGDEFVDLLGVK
jgi:hypothetical protein